MRVVTVACSHLPMLVSEVLDDLNYWLVRRLTVGAESPCNGRRFETNLVAHRVVERVRRQLQHIILLLLPAIMVPERMPLVGEEIWDFVGALVLVSGLDVE